MAVRTFYWNTRKVHPLNYYRFRLTEKDRMVFRYGNAGDIFNKDLIRFLYGEDSLNLSKKERRLLMVGSIASVIEKGDVICGIGTKDESMAIPKEIVESLTVLGVRG